MATWMSDDLNRIIDGFDEPLKSALNVLASYGQEDGAHHKTWCIDQAVRAILGPDYDEFVRAYQTGEDGPDSYEWDTGIAP